MNKFLLHQILTAPLIILVCLFSADLEAGVSIHSADGHGDYIRIYVGPPKNPFGLDWKSLVPDKYAEISPGPIPQNYLADFNEKKGDKYSLVEYSFVRSVPKSMTNKYYYLITKSGIHEIAISNLEVTVRFDLYRDKPSISYVSYWGLLVSRKNHNKRMQSDQIVRYARTLSADARRYKALRLL